jgi:hypothetical protein
MTNRPSRGTLRPRNRPVRLTAARITAILGAAAVIVGVVVAGAVTRGFGFFPSDAGSSQQSTAPTSLGGLSIRATWPYFQGCDGATTEIAATRAGPSPILLKVSPEFADGAAVFDVGHLNVRFTVAGNAVAEIKNIRPVIYTVSSEEPTRIYYLEGSGCADTDNRALQLDLDSKTLSDEGVVGDHDDDGDNDSPPAATVAPLDVSLHVSRKDPVQLRIDVDGCSASYQWGLEISYVISNRAFVKLIGTRRDPFRVLAAPNDPIPAYGINLASRNLGMHRLGTLTSSASCQIQFSRP